MMTAGSMLSKRPVLRITMVLFFLLQLFSSHFISKISKISWQYLTLVIAARACYSEYNVHGGS